MMLVDIVQDRLCIYATWMATLRSVQVFLVLRSIIRNGKTLILFILSKRSSDAAVATASSAAEMGPVDLSGSQSPGGADLLDVGRSSSTAGSLPNSREDRFRDDGSSDGGPPHDPVESGGVSVASAVSGTFDIGRKNPHGDVLSLLDQTTPPKPQKSLRLQDDLETGPDFVSSLIELRGCKNPVNYAVPGTGNPSLVLSSFCCAKPKKAGKSKKECHWKSSACQNDPPKWDGTCDEKSSGPCAVGTPPICGDYSIEEKPSENETKINSAKAAVAAALQAEAAKKAADLAKLEADRAKTDETLAKALDTVAAVSVTSVDRVPRQQRAAPSFFR